MAPAPLHPSDARPLAHAASHTLHVRHEGRNESMVIACAAAAAVPELDRRSAGWLGPEESRYAARLALAKRRGEFLLGRFAAKSALVAWLGGGELGAFDIVAGAFQQPIVHGPALRPAGVTIAHTSSLAMALAHDQGHPMGIDLERHDASRVEVVRTQVAASELPRERGGLDESAAYFLLWSAKEALSKALRCGLTCPFELLAVEGARIDGAGVCTGTFKHFGQYQFFGWMVADCTLVLVGAKHAEFAPALPALREFTLANAAATRAA